MLTDIAKQQLKKAGWYEGRKIDLSKYEEAYAKIGCELFPAARKFLEEYGDLGQHRTMPPINSHKSS